MCHKVARPAALFAVGGWLIRVPGERRSRLTTQRSDRPKAIAWVDVAGARRAAATTRMSVLRSDARCLKGASIVGSPNNRGER